MLSSRPFSTILILALSLAVAGCRSAQTRMDIQRNTDVGSWPEMDAAINQGIEEKLYPGAVILVGTADRITFARAYGHTSWEPDAPPTRLDTIYDMASVSKVMGTATATWLLLEDGRLGLDDRVSAFVPGFATGGKEDVRVRDLLTHVSGLKAYENYQTVERARREGETPADALIRHYAGLTVSYTPREKFVYSCLNFQTMAHINEQVAGRRQEDLLVERVFGPLGMGDTRYILSADQQARLAPTHSTATGQPAGMEVHDPLARYHGSWKGCPGNAGLYSTAPDVALYCQMILNQGRTAAGRVFRSTTIEAATSLQTPPGVGERRGLGWDIYEAVPYVTSLNQDPGHYIVGHTGYTGTLVLIDQHTSTFMVFLTNRTLSATPGQVDQNPSIQPVREEVWDLVLRRQPAYEDYFRDNPQTVRRRSASAYSTGGS